MKPCSIAIDGAERRGQMPTLKTPTLFIVDTVLENIHTLGTLFPADEVCVAFAVNSSEALARIKSELPDIILLDIMMPGMDGFSLCKLLKQSPSTRDIPIIILTAKKNPDDVVKGLDAGAVDYVTKPFIPIELAARIRRQLRLKQSRDALKETCRILHQREAKASRDTHATSEQLNRSRAALQVLLEQRQADKSELEETVLSNMKELVLPLIVGLKNSRLDTGQEETLQALEDRINRIISPFIKNISAPILKLTPMEIRVAQCVKEGKSNKEIGRQLSLSEHTVVFHRYNMRKKMGLNRKKINLQSYLQSLDA